MLAGLSEEVRETVIRRRGDTFAFSLLEGHALELLEVTDSAGRQLAHIRVPGAGGETCSVVATERREGEIEYTLKPTGARHSAGNQPLGYPWPAVQDEHARLRARWEAAGGDPARFEAWRQGASHESQFREWREEIRRLERDMRGPQ